MPTPAYTNPRTSSTSLRPPRTGGTELDSFRKGPDRMSDGTLHGAQNHVARHMEQFRDRIASSECLTGGP